MHVYIHVMIHKLPQFYRLPLFYYVLLLTEFFFRELWATFHSPFSVPFRVDPDSGWLSLTSPLDREEVPEYTLDIQAMDNGLPRLYARVTVNIDVQDANDNEPQFDRATYMVNILEKTPVGSVVAIVRADDPDEGPNGDVVYSLHSETKASQYFNIARISGLLTVAKPVLRPDLLQQGLIKEGNNTVFLIIRASDSGNPPLVSEAELKIHVDDMNDEAPAFTKDNYMVKLPEEAEAGNG